MLLWWMLTCLVVALINLWRQWQASPRPWLALNVLLFIISVGWWLHMPVPYGLSQVALQTINLPSQGQPILGNRKSMIYHLPSCRSYPRGELLPHWVLLASEEVAKESGFRKAKNCP
jgi:hypothetical protein